MWQWRSFGSGKKDEAASGMNMEEGVLVNSSCWHSKILPSFVSCLLFLRMNFFWILLFMIDTKLLTGADYLGSIW